MSSAFVRLESHHLAEKITGWIDNKESLLSILFGEDIFFKRLISGARSSLI